jgi:hypothetical protein
VVWGGGYGGFVHLGCRHAFQACSSCASPRKVRAQLHGVRDSHHAGRRHAAVRQDVRQVGRRASVVRFGRWT